MRISDWSSDVCSSDLSSLPSDSSIEKVWPVRLNSRMPPGKRVFSPFRLRFRNGKRLDHADCRNRFGREKPIATDRKSVGKGKRGSVSEDLGGRGILKRKISDKKKEKIETKTIK